jgi:hypothetical protein
MLGLSAAKTIVVASNTPPASNEPIRDLFGTLMSFLLLGNVVEKYSRTGIEFCEAQLIQKCKPVSNKDKTEKVVVHRGFSIKAPAHEK